MANFDVFSANMLESAGRIRRNPFKFKADQVLIWYQGNCIRQFNSNFVLNGKVSLLGEMYVSINNEKLKDYIDDSVSFDEISYLNDRIFWSNNLLGGGVGFKYPNMSLFYVGGEIARIYINTSIESAEILLEFLSPLARDVQEPESELSRFAREIASLKTQEINFDNVEFVSSSHQRYEHGEAVGGFQVGVRRSIIIRKNTNGCEGYDIERGDGYIFKILNLDGIHPLWGNNVQLSSKPVRIIFQDENKTVMRGYQCKAQGPFGWIPFDGSRYELIIEHKYGEITKCTFHRYDKDLKIEYYE